MATEKFLNTRIKLKFDSYSNWTANNPELYAGELAIATVQTNDANGKPGFHNLPNVVIKVGQEVDGQKLRYNDLPFVSALAADVHSWAKAASKPEYAYNEITGLEAELARVSTAADTDTQYTLVATDAANYKYELRSKGLKDAAWTRVADLDLSDLVSRISALEGKFAGMAENTVVAHVNARIADLDAAEVKAGAGEIIDSVKEVDGIVTATKRTLAAADIPELAQSKITGLTKALSDLEAKVGNDAGSAEQNAKDYADELIADLDYAGGEFGSHKFATKVTEANGVVAVEYAQPEIADVNGLETRLTGIEGDITDLGNNKQDNLAFEGTYNQASNKVVTKSAMTAAIQDLDYNGGDFAAHKFATKVTETDGVVAAEYAQPVIADIDGLTDRLSSIDGEIAKKQDIVPFTSTPSNDDKVATQSYVNTAVADLNGAMHFVGKLESVPSGNANNAYSAGDVILVGFDEYVFDGTTWQPLGNESLYHTRDEAHQEHEAMTKLITDLEKKHDDELAALTKKHNDEISALDAAYKKAIQDLDAAEVKAGQGEIIDSVKEADGVVTVTKRALVAADIPTIEQAQVNGLPKALSDLSTAISTGDANTLKSAKEYADGKVLSAIQDLDKADTAVEKQFVTAVSETDGIITVSRAALKATDIPVIEQTQVNGLGTALAGKETAGAAAAALTNARNYIDQKILDLDYSDAEVAKNVVTAVSEADGVINVTRKPLADIAWSGNVNDLVQTTGDVLIFNCGSATTVI